MQKGVRLIGNGQAPVHKYWKTILDDYLVTGKISPIDLIVTQRQATRSSIRKSGAYSDFLMYRISIEDVAKGYSALDHRAEGMVKFFVETKFSRPPSTGAPSLTTL